MSHKKLHGINAPHLKNTSGDKPVRIPVPPIVTIPVSMHIGAPAKPVVKAGDEVCVGQVIAESGGFVSAAIHSSVSGKVKKVDNMLTSSGQFVPVITIETDGLQTPFSGLEPPKIENSEDFIAAIRACGMVGLGGAGFPTAVKFSVKDLGMIDAVIVNGAECEPYITSDTRTMIDDTEYVWKGVELLQKYLSAKRVIIAIEANKPQCLEIYRDKCKNASGVEVKKLPAQYPQGGEKVLIFTCLGRMVPEGKLPIDAGAVVVNCTTLAGIAKYIETGMPLVEKCVTVDGSAVKEPKNVIVPIGTPMKDVFDFCGGFKEEPKKVLYGGPMMGISVPDLDEPILKTTNAILAFGQKEATLLEPSACIRCGRCIGACPLDLMPVEIENAYDVKDGERLKKLKVNLCMECGCCAYVCPAKRPLVQVNKLAKVVLRDYLSQKKAAEEKQAEAEKKAEAQKCDPEKKEADKK